MATDSEEIQETKLMVKRLHDAMIGTPESPEGFIAKTEKDIGVLMKFKGLIVKVFTAIISCIGLTSIGIWVRGYLGN